MSSFLPTRTLKSFSTVLIYMTSSPSLYSCLGLSWSTCRTLQLLNLMRFSWTHFLRLSRSFWLEFFLLRQMHCSASCHLQSCWACTGSHCIIDKDIEKEHPQDKGLEEHDSSLHLIEVIELLTTTLYLYPPRQFLIHCIVHPSHPCVSIWMSC